MLPIASIATRLAEALAPLLAAAAVSLGAWGLYERGLRMEAQSRVLSLQLEHERSARSAEAAARDASERYRALEQKLADVVRKAEKEYQDAVSKHRSALAGAQRDADGLRSQLAAANAAAAASSNPASALGEQSAARGELLEEALRLSAELAAAAEDHAAAVRALQRAWPSDPPK